MGSLARERQRLVCVDSDAINERRRLYLSYSDAQGEPTERIVWPLTLLYWGYSWAVGAWCELRQDFRNFRVDRIEESDSPGRVVYDPTHPDADENGNVTYPDVDVLSEMVDLMTTARSYEANTNALDVTRELAQQALEIGR